MVLLQNDTDNRLSVMIEGVPDVIVNSQGIMTKNRYSDSGGVYQGPSPEVRVRIGEGGLTLNVAPTATDLDVARLNTILTQWLSIKRQVQVVYI